MDLLCAECVDVAIKNGDDDHSGADEAISLFPAPTIAQTSAGVMAGFVPIPLCYKHRKLMKSKASLVTA